MSKLKYGQNTAEVEAFIANIEKLTPEQVKKFAADAVAADAVAADAADAADVAAAAAAAADAADVAADAADAAYAAAATDAYAAAADAAADAYAAATADAAYAAAATDAYAAAAATYWRYRWIFGRAAYALAIKHLIGQHDFTQNHYDILTKVVGEVAVLVGSSVEPENKYSFDRAQFSLLTTDIIEIHKAGIISTPEARYLIGFNK